MNVLEKLYSIHKSSNNVVNNVADVVACPYCGNNVLVRNSEGMLVCVRCGTVVQDYVVDVCRPEYLVVKARNRDEEVEHYKPTVLGLVLSSHVPDQVSVSRRLLSQLYSSEERWLIKTINMFKHLVGLFGLTNNSAETISKVSNIAREIYHTFARDKKAISALSTACALFWYFYAIVLNNSNVPRNLTEYVKKLRKLGINIREGEFRTVVEYLFNKYRTDFSRDRAIAQIVNSTVKKLHDVGILTEAEYIIVRKIVFEIVKTLLHIPRFQSRKLHTLTIAVLYIVLDALQGKIIYEKPRNHISLKTLCAICGGSTTSVGQLVRELKKYNMQIVLYV